MLIDYSVIIPVYNAQNTLVELVERIFSVMQSLQCEFEIIFVNDASQDDSWAVIKSLSLQYPSVSGYSLKPNLGRNRAILNGLKQSRGQRIIIIDDDLQHQPEDIPQLIAKVEEGYEVVFAKFPEKKHTRHKNICSRIMRGVEHFAYGTACDLQISGFQIISRRIAEKILHSKYMKPYMPGLYYRYAGLDNIANANATHKSRQNGRSSFNTWRSLRFLMNMISFANTKKFTITLFLGLFVFAGFVMGGSYLLLTHINLIQKPLNFVFTLIDIAIISGSILAGLVYILLFFCFNKKHENLSQYIFERTETA